MSLRLQIGTMGMVFLPKLISLKLAVFLLLTTSAHAEPLYLSCKGHGYTVEEHPEPEPAMLSVTIDGTSLKVESYAPVQIFSGNDNIWKFGATEDSPNSVLWGEINRITGQVQIEFRIIKPITSRFEGVCHKAERFF